MKIISPTMHGALDYLTCGFFLIIPSLFNLYDGAATVCYLLAAGYLVISLCTNMPFGLFGLIPFWVHGGLELVSGFVFIASPWLFGFAHPAHNSENIGLRSLFIGVGVVFLIVYALTDWRAATDVKNSSATS